MAPHRHGGPSRRVQRREDESDESADESPLSEDEEGSVAPSPSRRKGKSRADGPTGGAQHGADDDQAGWSVSEYKSRPTQGSPENQRLIRAAMEDIKSFQRGIDDALEKFRDMARSIEETRDRNKDEDDEDEASILLKELDATYLRMLDEREILQIRYDVMDSISEQLKARKHILDPDQTFKKESSAREATWAQKTLRQKFSKSEDYKEFRETIWNVHRMDQACPPVSHWLERQDGDESDSDIEMGGQTQNYRCPLSLRPIEDAVTCTICKHSYSRKNIEELLAHSGVRNTTQRRAKTKCPIAGCKVVVSADVLVSNPKLQQKADEYVRKLKLRAEEEADAVSVDDLE